ncbi:hypothetical protein [Geminicoccus flavidas]|uniref:hypothetical protein n=1 Tax=Geminicoccus flavidas TaxID=2506407 RepID=UPI0013583EEA|nr:hypothetical protein [Geminicoccus flavidas]
MRIRVLLMVLLAGLASWASSFGTMLGGSFMTPKQHMTKRLDCLDAALAGRPAMQCRNEPGWHVLLTNPVAARS